MANPSTDIISAFVMHLYAGTAGAVGSSATTISSAVTSEKREVLEEERREEGAKEDAVARKERKRRNFMFLFLLGRGEVGCVNILYG